MPNEGSRIFYSVYLVAVCPVVPVGLGCGGWAVIFLKIWAVVMVVLYILFIF